MPTTAWWIGPRVRFHQAACVLLIALACNAAHAQSSMSYSVGTGAGDYRSQTLEASLAPPEWVVKFDADLMQARENGASAMDQHGLGMTWSPLPAWSFRYRFSNQKDPVFRVDGQELGATWRLDKWWGSDLETRLDLGAGAFDYSGRNASAAQSRLLPDQRRYSLGLRQDLSKSFGAYASYDHYSYTRDPVALARLTAVSKRPRAGAAFALTSFAANARTIGTTWAALDTLDFDLSRGRTNTVLGQHQDVIRLAATLSATRNASVTLAYSDNRSNAVLRPSGATLIARERSSALDLTLGWTFD